MRISVFNYLFKISLLFIVTTALAEAADPAGKVLTVTGELSAVDQGVARSLGRGDEFRLGEILVTGNGSSAQIRLTDNTLFTLDEATQFKVNELSAAAKTTTTELVTGGLRAITGDWANDNPAGWNLQTSAATLGIRGTEFVAVMANNGLTTQVMQGQIALTNSFGTTLVNAGQYGSAVANAAPTMSLTAPAGFAPGASLGASPAAGAAAAGGAGAVGGAAGAAGIGGALGIGGGLTALGAVAIGAAVVGVAAAVTDNDDDTASTHESTSTHSTSSHHQ